MQVLLAHPSGAYNRGAPWSLPQDLPEPGESRADAARRETLEETGVAAADLHPLGWIDDTRSRKRIYAFAGPAPNNAQPRCASWEIDVAEFVDLDTARRRIHPDQRVFVDRLEAWLGLSPP